MRIASNTVSDNILNQLQKLGTNQANLQTQIATGLRISKPEDDPAAFGRAVNFQSEQRRIAQYTTNASTALAVSQASYEGLKTLKGVSDRAGEIATLGAGVLGQDAANSYATEVNQLIEQALQTANNAYNGNYLYAGTAVGAPPFTAARDAAGNVTSVTNGGDTGTAAIALSENSTIVPGTSSDTNTGIGDFITRLIGLRDALKSGNTAAVSATQTGLTNSEDLVISSMAYAGGIQTRIEAAQNQLAGRTTTLVGLISDNSSTDITTSVVKLSQASTAYEAALSSASKIMKLSLLDYLN